MPITHITFLIACLAIAGIPPFAGFFSKEEILMAAFHSNKIIYAVALFTSGLTAFYMFRLYFSIFWKKESYVHNDHGEGSLSMKIPLIILGSLAVVAGFFPMASFITSDGAALETHIDIVFSIAPVLLAVAGILFASYLYKSENSKPDSIATSLGGFYTAAHKKFYMDELYLFITQKIIFNLIGKPAAWIDKNIVDGLMNAFAELTEFVSDQIKEFQSGKTQQYAVYFFAGTIGFVLLFIYFRN